MTNDKLAELIEEIAVNTESYYKQDVLRTARDRLRDEWIPLDKFLKHPTNGLCWIEYKGMVIDAWYSSKLAAFNHSRCSFDWYPTEYITRVQPIKEPGLPE